jgi:hypothetical protein
MLPLTEAFNSAADAHHGTCRDERVNCPDAPPIRALGLDRGNSSAERSEMRGSSFVPLHAEPTNASYAATLSNCGASPKVMVSVTAL